MKRTILLCLMATALTAPAFAQSAQDRQSGEGLDDIIVTAQKRAEGLSDVPISISAVSGKLLWQYARKVPEHAGPELRKAWGTRGMAYVNGCVFVGTMDGRLIALDAKTGMLMRACRCKPCHDRPSK